MLEGSRSVERCEKGGRGVWRRCEVQGRVLAPTCWRMTRRTREQEDLPQVAVCRSLLDIFYTIC